MTSTEWAAKKKADRDIVDQKRMARILNSPAARGEVYQQLGAMQQGIAGVALAIEAFEELLIRKGTLEKDELMGKIKEIIATQDEQEAARAAANAHKGGGLVTLTDAEILNA